MKLTGHQLIGNTEYGSGEKSFKSFNPESETEFGMGFFEAQPEEVDRAVKFAEKAFYIYRKTEEKQRAEFLNIIAEDLIRHSPELIETCEKETALPVARLEGEMLRTTNQIRMFADLILGNGWKEHSIDEAQPDRKPVPKPQIERKLIPIGPVVVFGASNFPLAFSVAGGDTVSALAAGCSVIVKANPAHPATSEYVGRIILEAAKSCNLPEGVFSLLQGKKHDTGRTLVAHPGIQAVGFTGSKRGGSELFRIGANRAIPIPVYAEMGSTNPVFILPEKIKESPKKLAEGIYNSVVLGVGQFCTNPGIIFVRKDSDYTDFIDELKVLFSVPYSGKMLTPAICRNYGDCSKSLMDIEGINAVNANVTQNSTTAFANLYQTDYSVYVDHAALQEEIFGPSSLLVFVKDKDELLSAARSIEGQLTVSIHATADELKNYRALVDILELKAGRIIFNGYPTGVEVCPSMHHGGPYPASSDIRFSSVGTSAIKRWLRPLSIQYS